MIRFHQYLLAAIPIIAASVVLMGIASAAPVPYSLAHAFDSPSTARQTQTRLGYSVAINAGFIVVGSPYDHIGGNESGVVWIHDSATGAFLHRFDNPLNQSHFGWSVAVSGSRVVVGAPEDNTGADDAGIAYVFDLSSPTPAVPVLVLANPYPDSDDAFGWSVAISGDRVVVGVPGGDFGTPDAGSAYLYDLSSGTPQVPVLGIANPNPAGKGFGYSVAVDGASVAVGSIQGSGPGDSCRAYVFDVSSGTPGLPAFTLADPSLETNDQFGFSVDLAGSHVVVTAPMDDTGAVNSGAVYVFDLSSGTPETPIRTLLNPTPAAGDSFGISVSISGVSILVGANLDDQGAVDSGMAYVFDLVSPAPAQPVFTLNNPSVNSKDEFGRAVSISGSRLVVGALMDSTGGSDVGSAYVFDLKSGTPNQSLFMINNPSPSSHEEFGASVAVSGNLAVVGSPKDDKGSSNAGSVSVFDFSSPTPTLPLVVIDNPGPASNDYFGKAVAAWGNLVVVGADHDDTGASNAGIVYIYNPTSGTPTVPLRTLPNPAPQSSDEFGSSLAIEGQKVVVGCIRNKLAGIEAGSAYVFDLSSATPGVPVAVLDCPAPAAGDSFGQAVAVSGSLVVVGAHGKDSGAIDAGSAYVFDLTSPTPGTPIFTLDNPVPGAGDMFGYSVTISGPYVIIGCPMDDSVASNAGSVYVYDLASETPTVPVVVNYPHAEAGAQFGSSVAIAGTRFVVGAPEDEIEVSNGGACYVYELASATFPTPAARLRTGFQSKDGLFGDHVAIHGTNILVGSPAFDANTEDRGAAYLFDPDPPSPELQVEQPPGIGLEGGGANIAFGNIPVGTATVQQQVNVRNIGTADLQVSDIAILGGDAADFSIEIPSLPVVLTIDQTMTFNVSFVPGTKGLRTSTLRINSNAGTGNPFDVTLSGQALSPDDDTDGDGVNDVAELGMEAMGFDWQVNDEELLLIMQSGANGVGLFSLQQLQDINPSATLLPMNPATGQFKLTIGVGKSADLTGFGPLPMEESQTAINGQGRFEFHFTPSEPAAFFRLEPR